jgi:translation initiation factor IF-3
MNKKEKFFNKTNRQIRHPEVRIVGDNIESQILSINEAIKMAESMELDLIEISPTAKPPVCKIMDYNKFIYQEKKKRKDQEKKQRENKIEVKEMRFGPNTGDHDFEFKKNHIINFLKKGDRVKTYVFFKGREIAFKDNGKILLLKLADEVEEYGSPESLPRMEGRKLIMNLNPKKK